MPDEEVISEELQNRVRHLIAERLPQFKDRIGFELQEDGRFLLITLICGTALPASEHLRRQIGHGIDDLVPKRVGELTWMLNFVVDGTVEDSYFGGDSESPQLGF